MPTISACIVAYCDYEEVCAAVRSILHFTPAPDFTLYIVDNASPDGCGKQLGRHRLGRPPRAGALPAGERRLWPRPQRRAWQTAQQRAFYLKPRHCSDRGYFAADGRMAAGPARRGHGHPAAALPRRPACSTCPGASPRPGCCWPASWHQSSVERSKKPTTTTPCRTRI